MYRDGFIAEAQMTGQLEHPNIVPLHELAGQSRWPSKLQRTARAVVERCPAAKML